MYVAFARSSMRSVDAPTVPAPDEVLNGAAKRQHSRTELPPWATIAVTSRNVPFAMLGLLSAKAETAAPTTSDAKILG